MSFKLYTAVKPQNLTTPLLHENRMIETVVYVATSAFHSILDGIR